MKKIFEKIKLLKFFKKQKFIFLHFWKLEVQKVKVLAGLVPPECHEEQISISKRPPSLLHIVLSQSGSLCPNFSFLWGHQSFRLRPILMTSFEFHYLSKDPISKPGHIRRYWGWRHLHRNSGRCNSTGSLREIHLFIPLTWGLAIWLAWANRMWAKVTVSNSKTISYETLHVFTCSSWSFDLCNQDVTPQSEFQNKTKENLT